MRRKAVVAGQCFGLRLVGVALTATTAFTLLVSNTVAQQPGPAPRAHLNQIIEQAEQGRPSFVNEQWQFFTFTGSPFLVNDLEKLLANLRSEGSRPRLTPIVRIAQQGDQDYKHLIKQLLNVGVLGIIVPDVETKEQALKLVQTMRYPPQHGAMYPKPVGIRGCCPGDAPEYLGLSLHEYMQRADVWPLNPEGELLALVMIESHEAVKNIDEILKVPGIAGALVGPYDLSMSLGVGTPEANPAAPEVEAATAAVAKACVAHKSLCGTFEGLKNTNDRLAQGFKLFPLPRSRATPR